MVSSQTLSDEVEFAENPDPRCPCVLVLDTSGSMQGPRIDELNAGLQVFKESLARDPLALRRVEVAVVAFDSVARVAQPFVTADAFDPPTLTAQNLTCMGAALTQALDLLDARKQSYRKAGVPYYRPWLFLVTDGEPQGEEPAVLEGAVKRLHADAGAKRVAVFAVAVGDEANVPELQRIAGKTPLRLKGLAFKELFQWLSASMQRVSQSKVGEQVALPPPDWGAV